MLRKKGFQEFVFVWCAFSLQSEKIWLKKVRVSILVLSDSESIPISSVIRKCAKRSLKKVQEQWSCLIFLEGERGACSKYNFKFGCVSVIVLSLFIKRKSEFEFPKISILTKS